MEISPEQLQTFSDEFQDYEQSVMDSETGQLLTGHFAYDLARISVMCRLVYMRMRAFEENGPQEAVNE